MAATSWRLLHAVLGRTTRGLQKGRNEKEKHIKRHEARLDSPDSNRPDQYEVIVMTEYATVSHGHGSDDTTPRNSGDMTRCVRVNWDEKA